MNTVIFGADEGQITINLGDGSYSKVDAAGLLFAVILVTKALIDLGVKPSDEFLYSSTMDFDDEEGFAPGEAQEIVDQALIELKQDYNERNDV